MDSALPEQTGHQRFFHPEDWRSFCLTAVVVFSVYFLTLAPDVTLEHSGIYSAAAKYAGVGPPPGYPLWTIYGWLFAKLFPFGNIAWRLAISSAIAGALTCGVIALMVSRCGAILVPATRSKANGEDSIFEAGTLLKPAEERNLRIVSGYVAGAAFGFSGGFWKSCVVVDVWPLSLLLFCTTLCFLMRWFWAPEQKRWFLAAVFFYGLTLTNSQILASTALGLLVLIVIGRPALGRDAFFSVAVFLIAFVALDRSSDFLLRYRNNSKWFGIAALVAMSISAVIAFRTRKIFTEWRNVLSGGFLFLAGLSLYLYIAIASMTNPPVNWGYPRTPEGFLHALRRGQYERIQVADDSLRFAQQMGMCGKIMLEDFGVIYFLPIIVLLFWFRKMPSRLCRWLVALIFLYLSMVLFLIFVLNPDLRSLGPLSHYLTATYPLLAVGAGCGLVLTGTELAKNPRQQA